MLLRVLFLILAGFMAMVPASFSHAKMNEGIAVVVNEGLISHSDVLNRISLIIQSSGMPDTQETRDRLLPQIVKSLVEEELQLQEGARLGFEASDEEVALAFKNIAQSNGATVDQFRQGLRQRGVSLESLYRQLRAQIVWRKVFSGDLAQQVRVNDADIRAFIGRLESLAGAREYLLSEIFLPVESARDDQKIRQLAQKVVRDIRLKKANFGAVAQQISKSPGANRGGIKGWVQADQMDENVAEVVQGMVVKTISDPVRSIAGYHIMMLMDVRQVSADSIPSEDEVRDQIFAERADRVSRGRLADLRSAAFIEYRL